MYDLSINDQTVATGTLEQMYKLLPPNAELSSIFTVHLPFSTEEFHIFWTPDGQEVVIESSPTKTPTKRKKHI